MGSVKIGDELCKCDQRVIDAFDGRIRELEAERDELDREATQRCELHEERIRELEKLLYDLRDEYGYPYSLDLEDRITATLKDGGKRMRERR